MNIQRPYSNPYLEVEAESGQTIISYTITYFWHESMNGEDR